MDREIDAVLRSGAMISNDRSKEIARRMIYCFRFYWPKILAMREAVYATNKLFKTVLSTFDTIVRVDNAYCADPDKEEFFTPELEMGTRAALNMRRAAEEGKVQTEADWEAISPVAFEQARNAMRARGKEPPLLREDLQFKVPGLDYVPLAFLQLKALIAKMAPIVDPMIYDEGKQPSPVNLLAHVLAAGFTPYPSSNRPPMEFAQFIAWLLQDTGPREPRDDQVVAFIEQECASWPTGMPKLIPTAKSVGDWRRDREKIAGICPRRDKDKKPE